MEEMSIDGKILVTGATGWLGSRLVAVLATASRGSRSIRCLVTKGADTSLLMGDRRKIEIFEGDLKSYSDCEKFCADAEGAVLFHCAGIIHPRKIKEFYHVNVEGTRNILDTSIRAGVKRAVIVSSNSPCGVNPHPDHMFDEDSAYHPYMNYGKSKMLMELVVKERTQKIETVIVRAPWFYGPNQPPRQTLFFRMIRDGKFPFVGDGGNLRSMVYIDNLVQGLIRAAGCAAAVGQIYWIADERPYAIHEIIETVENLLESEFNQKCTHARVRFPEVVGSVSTWLDRCLQSMGIYNQKIHVLSEMNKNIVCSINKARRDLGYIPSVSLEEGMRRSLVWCEKTGGLT